MYKYWFLIFFKIHVIGLLYHIFSGFRSYFLEVFHIEFLKKSHKTLLLNNKFNELKYYGTPTIIPKNKKVHVILVKNN